MTASDVTRDQAEAGERAGLLAWWSILLLTLASLSSYVDRQILSLLTESIKADLHVSDTAIGLLQGMAFGAFYACAGVPMGWLADRAPRRLLLACCIAIWSGMTTVSGFAQNYAQLFLARMGVGIGEAALSPTAAPLIRDLFPKSLLGRALSLYMLAIPLGGGLAIVLGATILPWVESIGAIALPFEVSIKPWQMTFMLVGAPGLVIAMGFLTTKDPARRRGADAAMGLGHAFQFLALHKKTFIAFALPGVVSMLLTFGVGFWIPAVFRRSYGLAGGEAAEYLRMWGYLSMALGIAGALGAGALADAMRKRRRDAYVVVTLIGFVVFAISYGLFSLMPTPQLALLALAPGALAAGVPPTTSAAATMELAPARMRSLLMALWFLLIGLLGQGLGPVVIALVTDNIFHDETALRFSIPIVVGIGAVFTAPLLFWVRGPYCKTAAAAETWAP
jgi:MFS family permease